MAFRTECRPTPCTLNVPRSAAGEREPEGHPGPAELDAVGDEIRSRRGGARQAVAQAPPADPGRGLARQRVVRADDRGAVEGEIVGEALERLQQPADRAVVVHVLPVDVGDDTDDGVESQEGTVRLVGLDQQVVALSEPGVGSDRGDPSPDNHRRVLAAGAEHGGAHGGCRGLAVAAGHGDAELDPHQLREQLAPGDHGQPAAPRFGEFGVVAGDRRAGHDRLRVSEVVRRVADADRGSEAGQPLRDGRLANIGTGHGVSEIKQDLGDPAHADPSDPDEVEPSLPERFPGEEHA